MKFIKLILILILIFTFEAFTLRLAEGQDMSSTNYQLQGGNFNTAAGTASSNGYSLNDLIGTTQAQIFTSKGYIVNSGLMGIKGNDLLAFSLSPSIINFGTFKTSKEYKQNILLTVSNNDLAGYKVYIAQDHPLQTESGAQIPNTVCDAAKGSACNKNKSNIWKDNKSFGLGFTLVGKNLPSPFQMDRSYRPFPNLDYQEKPTLVMESLFNKASDTMDLELKLLIPDTQAVGIYQNTLSFSVVPGY